MNTLLPLILTCLGVGVVCLGLALYGEYKKWPAKGPPSKYGEFRVEDVRRITEQSKRR